MQRARVWIRLYGSYSGKHIHTFKNMIRYPLLCPVRVGGSRRQYLQITHGTRTGLQELSARQSPISLQLTHRGCWERLTDAACAGANDSQGGGRCLLRVFRRTVQMHGLLADSTCMDSSPHTVPLFFHAARTHPAQVPIRYRCDLLEACGQAYESSFTTHPGPMVSDLPCNVRREGG